MIRRCLTKIAIACIAAVALCLPPVAVAQEKHELKDGKWVKVAPPVEGTPEGELSLMRELVKEGDGITAVLLANKYLKQYPDDPGREEMLLLAGEAEMASERYYQAFEFFKRQLDEFPNGTYSEKALQREYEVAEAFLTGKPRVVAYVLYLPARTEGQEILGKITEQAPRSAIAELAMLRLGDDYETHYEWAQAAQAYDHYVSIFPKSPKAKDAQFRAAVDTFKTYRPGFDDTSLAEAQHRFTAFKETYPETATKKNVAGMLKTIETDKAEETFSSARLYERMGEKSAAAYYYRRTKDLYPETTWGKQADAAILHLGVTPKVKPPEPIIFSRTLAAKPVEPTPAAVTRPVYTRPLLEPESQPSEQPEPIKTLVPSSQSATMPADQKRPPATQPTTEPSTEPSTAPATEPTTEPSTEPATAPTTEPATERATAPAATEPAATEPGATQPAAKEPDTTVPATNPPATTEPSATQSATDHRRSVIGGRL